MTSPTRGSTSLTSPAQLRVVLCGGLLAGYGGLVLGVALWPTPVDAGLGPVISSLLQALHRNGVPGWIGYRELEFAANVALFFPLGMLLTLTLPSGARRQTLLLLPACSVAIEVVQALLLAGRDGSARDVVANTVGGYLGFAAALVLRRLVRLRDRLVASTVPPIGRG